MSRYKKLITVCCVAVLTLGLAACGGGGGGTASTGTPGAMPPVIPPVIPKKRTLEELLAKAQNAKDAATTAAGAATTAVDNAVKYSSMFDTLSVNGDSAMAEANAGKVLAEQTAATTAVTDADEALQAAMRAKDDAQPLLADSANADAINSIFDDAIAEAKAQAAQAKANRDVNPFVDGSTTDRTPAVDSLAEAVEAVTGEVDLEADTPIPGKTAAEHGQDVAMAIGMALGPNADGSGLRVTHTDDLAIPPMGAVEMNDHQGKTWAEIADNVMTVRIASVQTKVASIDGMTGTDVNSSLDENYADPMEGASVNNSSYNGIPGTAYCLGTDCKVDDDDEGKLAGGWYFAPTSPEVYYEKVGDATTYTAETNYARFGHWLVVGVDGEATVNTYADGGVAGTNMSGLALNVNTDDDATTLTDTEATYSGTAVGMSLHKEVDALSDAVEGSLSSGAFSANVTLKATFADAPMLGGTIDGFTSVNGGNNVDPGWTVELTETTLSETAGVTDGVANASGQDGEWTAQGYGTDGARPTGFFGGFSAHFTDGHASGAYATRK